MAEGKKRRPCFEIFLPSPPSDYFEEGQTCFHVCVYEIFISDRSFDSYGLWMAAIPYEN